jgi:predicted MFS family arabinose efflux permease
LLVGLWCSILVIGFVESSIYALIDSFDRAPTFAGVLVTVQGVGAVAGGLTASRLVRRLGEVAATATGLAAMALSTAVVALARDLTVVFAGVVILGIAIPWTFVAFTTLMQRRTPGHLIGRVSATVDVVLSTPQAVSLALGSLLVSLLDYRTIFWIIAAVMTAGALQIATTLRDQIRADIRSGGTPQDPVPAPEADLTSGADLL